MDKSEPSYKIVRVYQRPEMAARVIKYGLTLEGAQAHCQNPETASATCTLPERIEHTERYGEWMDTYTREEGEDDG